MDKRNSYCYELQALRRWIRELDVEIRRTPDPDPDDADFLLQLDLCYFNLLEDYTETYEEGTNMIHPSVFAKEFHYALQNLDQKIIDLFPKTKFETEKVTFIIEQELWRDHIEIIDEFLTYLQDPNWPIAHVAIDFFNSLTDKNILVEPLKRALNESLKSADDFWGFNLLQYIVTNLSKDIIEKLTDDLIAWSRSDFLTSIEALKIVGEFKLLEEKQLKNKYNNMIRALDEWSDELKKLREELE